MRSSETPPKPGPGSPDVAAYNRRAWDNLVDRGDRWTLPVGPEVIAAARRGEWEVILTPVRPVPRSWFPPLEGLPTLLLAGSGGQQAPILAAAGADVTVLDNSPKQLGQDRFVAERDSLEIRTVLGDMRDLNAFADESFGLVVHPCSNCFVPSVLPVWREAARVLRPGGVLLAGFINPVFFIFDDKLMDAGELRVRHTIPYSDFGSLTDQERQAYIDAGEPLVYGHSLEDQIGGQADAGLVITGLFEDTWPERTISKYLATFVATRSVKPA